ncbi:MAG TPA: hypothetical protein VJN18_15345 [Polyangiaceae bacterium]|nr:hypothetical protein [Polyangiaceae bacterium]
MSKTAAIKRASLLAALATTAISGAPAASSSGNEKLTELTIHYAGTNVALVRTTNVVAQVNRPGCHQTWFDRHYMFDVSTSKGKAMFSQLTAAYLAGYSVVLQGGANCTTAGGDVVETLTGVRMYNF